MTNEPENDKAPPPTIHEDSGKQEMNMETEELMLSQDVIDGLRYFREIHETPMSKYVEELHFRAVDDVLRFVQTLKGREWVFRGQADVNWPLEPSLDRTCSGRTIEDAE